MLASEAEFLSGEPTLALFNLFLSLKHSTSFRKLPNTGLERSWDTLTFFCILFSQSDRFIFKSTTRSIPFFDAT
ncbi:hypothetical protein Hanom_Chr03g00273791 [Helianthus anomalus]